MIEYRKTSKECREAYFAYLDAPLVSASDASASSFVAGWNAAIASIGRGPAKEPAEHPAGSKPDPGEGYRLLSKDSEEELQMGDEIWNTHGDYWLKPCHWEPFGRQDANLWYRRKIEPHEPG